MKYKEWVKKAKLQFKEEFPDHELLLIWGNRKVIFGKMVFTVESKFDNKLIRNKIIVEKEG